MNINSINTKSSSDAITSPKKYLGLQSIGQKGQIVEGLITKVSDKVSIDFSGKEVMTSKSAVRDAKEGEIRKFEIKDISDNSIVLKEVGSGTNDTGVIKATCTNVETDQTTFKEHLEKSLEEKEEEALAEKEAMKAKECLEDIASRMSAKDYEELMKEGDILKAYDVIRLDKAIARVKEQSVQKEEGIEKQVQNHAREQEALTQTANNNKEGIKGNEEIVKRLEEANLPVTEINIAKIATAIDLSGRLDTITDKEMCYLIGNNLEPTIENLYKAAYSSVNSKEVTISDTALNELKNQIDTVINTAGLEINDKNQSKAIWLLEHNLPLTKENLLNLKQLDEINIAMQDSRYKDGILDKVITSLSKGVAPEKTNLEDSSKNITNVISIINNTSNDTIRKAMELTQVITIASLKKANGLLLEEGTINTVDSNGISQADVDSTGIEIATPEEIRFITARRQLEEIRLKMTVEAGQKLMDKGFHLDTEELSKIVEGLKQQEDAYYRNLLKEADTSNTIENVLIFKETTEKLNDIKIMPYYLLGSTLKSRGVETISTLHQEGSVLKIQLDKVNASYDTLMTEPRSDLGDSIQKAFTSVDSILADMNLEITNGNQRAVKILGYNNMEITKEAINEVKSYDVELNKLMNEMHPAVVVDMIKEGTNPLNTSIQELNEQISQRKERLGITEEEKYSTFLWKLEKEKGITEEERKTYIGIYRLLNNVEKTDGAALGAVIKAEQDVTLNHLLTAVRTIKGSGMDATIDDNYGFLKSLNFSKENITSQLAATFQTDTKMESSQDVNLTQQDINIEKQNRIHEEVNYMENLLSNIINEITPAKLSSLKETMNTSEDLLNLSLEKLYEDLESTRDNEVLSEEFLEQKVRAIQDITKNSEEPIRFLQNHDIPATVNHIIAAGEYLEQGNQVYHKVKNLLDKSNDLEKIDRKEAIHNSMNQLVEALVDEETMIEQYNELDQKINQLLSNEMGNSTISSKDITELKSISGTMEFVKALSNSRNYEVPLLIGDSITNINLKIITGTKETGKIDMSIYSERLGNIEAKFTIKGDEVKGLILCDNREGLDRIKGNQESLVERITNLELTLKQLDYASYRKSNGTLTTNMTQSKDGENVNTQQLYQVAKSLVYHIKEIEQQNS